MSKKKLTSAIDLFLPSVNIIRNNLPTFFVLLVVPLLLTSLTGPSTPLSAQPTFKEIIESLQATITPLVALGSLLSFFFYPPLAFAEWRTSSGKLTSLSEAFKGSRPLYWRLLGLIICTGLAVTVGLILFIIPGIIMLRRYILAPYFMIENNLGIFEAMKQAAKRTKPVSGSIYSIFLVTLLLSLFSSIGQIGLAIGTILSLLYKLAFALRYHEIK